MSITQADLDNMLIQFKEFSTKSNKDLLEKMSEEFQGKLNALEQRLRAEFTGKLAEVEARATPVEPRMSSSSEEGRGAKFLRTGTSSRRAASADGHQPRNQVVLLGFPSELMQPTLQRVAEAVRQKIGHVGCQPKIKVFDFSRKVSFIFQSEAQAMSFAERAEAHELPVTCPITSENVNLRLKIHVPAEERTHSKTVGALRNQILLVKKELDLGSNGARGDVFIRNGEQGLKIFKVLAEAQEGKHKIEPHWAALQQSAFSKEDVESIISATYAAVQQPIRS